MDVRLVLLLRCCCWQSIVCNRLKYIVGSKFQVVYLVNLTLDVPKGVAIHMRKFGREEEHAIAIIFSQIVLWQ